MLFADDCFLFFQAPPKEGEAMRHILSLYELASGQSINLNKSKIFYSRNVPSNVQNTITNIMGAECLGMGRYLGVPSLVGRSKRAVFGHVRDKVWKRIQSWEGHWLSSAGNEVMIKAVLQAIPTYYISIYLLPDSLVDEIHILLNCFWWNLKKDTQGGIK
ncbi:hypothetical protein AAZX31_01G114300 [Glycine max]